MDITNVSPAAVVDAAVQMKQAQQTQDVQVAVLKKALDVQAAGAMALLQALPGDLPLATSGSLGTQVNTMA